MAKQRAATKLPARQDAIQRRMEATDSEIDWLVYELHELTGEETTIVEYATSLAAGAPFGCQQYFLPEGFPDARHPGYDGLKENSP